MRRDVFKLRLINDQQPIHWWYIDPLYFKKTYLNKFDKMGRDVYRMRLRNG